LPDSREIDTEPGPTKRELDVGERVSRFIYSKRHMKSAIVRPLPGAFDPSPYTELSVAHSTDLSDEEIWNIAVSALGSQAGRDTIYSRADVPVRELIQKKLRAVRDDDPFERHTCVVGWPEVPGKDERKQLWKQICLELSQHPDVKLVLPATPISKSSQLSE